MKFSAATVAWAAAFFASGAFADDAQKVLKDESSTAAESSSTSTAAADLPTFTVSPPHDGPVDCSSARSSRVHWHRRGPTSSRRNPMRSWTSADHCPYQPTTLKAPFLEQFTDDWDKRWKPSHAKKDMKGSDNAEEEWAYVGEWSVEEPIVYKGMEGDKGLVVKNPAAHHAISAKFAKPIDNKGQDLVVQYEVKLQKGLECGGAYMKLLRNDKKLASDEFSNASPYVIMFGPDKCGSTNKVSVHCFAKNGWG